MVVTNLYRNIYKMTVENRNIRHYLGLGENLDLDEDDLNNLPPKDQQEYKAKLKADRILSAKKIQKRAQPVEVADNVPLITFYTPPGGVDIGNDTVYVTNVVFDVYTHDNVEVAHGISDEIFKMFNKKLLPMMGLTNFQTKFKSAHESSVDLENIYCFSTVIEFSIEIEQ